MRSACEPGPMMRFTSLRQPDILNPYRAPDRGVGVVWVVRTGKTAATCRIGNATRSGRESGRHTQRVLLNSHKTSELDRLAEPVSALSYGARRISSMTEIRPRGRLLGRGFPRHSHLGSVLFTRPSSGMTIRQSAPAVPRRPSSGGSSPKRMRLGEAALFRIIDPASMARRPMRRRATESKIHDQTHADRLHPPGRDPGRGGRRKPPGRL